MTEEKIRNMLKEMEAFRKDMNKFLDESLFMDKGKSNYDDFVSIFDDLRNKKINIDKAEEEVINLFGVVLDEVSLDYRKLSRETQEEHFKEVDELEKKIDELRGL